MNHTNKIEARVSSSTSQLAGKSPEEIAAEKYWDRLKAAKLSCPACNSYLAEWKTRARYSARAKQSNEMIAKSNRKMDALIKLIPREFLDLL